MKLSIASDHSGFEMKTQLYEFLNNYGYEIADIGPYSYDATDDYPDYAIKIGYSITSHKSAKGIMICGSGVGASVAANKLKGIRAGVCHDIYSAHQGVEHDDMNLLCLGARIIGIELAKELVISFLNAEFTAEQRHQRRLNKILDLEQNNK
jgi:ribose 5-phosphate isomerase B